MPSDAPVFFQPTGSSCCVRVGRSRCAAANTHSHSAAHDVLPKFSQPHVEIQTEALGLSAEEVEPMITVDLEQDLLNGVPWLQTIRSESETGRSIPYVAQVFLSGSPDHAVACRSFFRRECLDVLARLQRFAPRQNDHAVHVDSLQHFHFRTATQSKRHVMPHRLPRFDAPTIRL